MGKTKADYLLPLKISEQNYATDVGNMNLYTQLWEIKMADTFFEDTINSSSHSTSENLFLHMSIFKD